MTYFLTRYSLAIQPPIDYQEILQRRNSEELQSCRLSIQLIIYSSSLLHDLDVVLFLFNICQPAIRLMTTSLSITFHFSISACLF
jgi:hypothetical protein